MIIDEQPSHLVVSPSTTIIPGSLATYGYAAAKTLPWWELDAAMHANLRALLIDVRTTPHCQWAGRWNKEQLSQAWGMRYVWKGTTLGNESYHDPAKGIRVARLEQGVQFLIKLMERGQTCILLCGCAHYEACHRKTIFDAVCAQLGNRFPVLVQGQAVIAPLGPAHLNDDIPIEIMRMRNRYTIRYDDAALGCKFADLADLNAMEQPMPRA